MRSNNSSLPPDLAERKRKFSVLRNPVEADLKRIQPEQSATCEFLEHVRSCVTDLMTAREVLANPGLRRMVELPNAEWATEIDALLAVESALEDRHKDLGAQIDELRSRNGGVA